MADDPPALFSASPHANEAIDTFSSLHPRPFYVIGHNTNSTDEVKDVLALGANAIEPDVNIYSNRSRPGLCISHGEGDDAAPPIDEFLNSLALIARAYPRLAL